MFVVHLLSGDVVGPSFFSSKMNAISVLGQQYDTGEPIAFTVALNIWWMEYLHAINQLDEVRQRNAIAVINKGEIIVRTLVCVSICFYKYQTVSNEATTNVCVAIIACFLLYNS